MVCQSSQGIYICITNITVCRTPPRLIKLTGLTDVGEIVLTYFKMWYIIIITTNEMVSMRTHRRTPLELQLRRRSFLGLLCRTSYLSNHFFMFFVFDTQKSGKCKTIYRFSVKIFGGKRGIRTLGTLLTYTRVPVVRLRPAQPSFHPYSALRACGASDGT